MTEEEIKNYCVVGSGGICIYRKRVKKAQFIVQSIYILGNETNGYVVHVEFDPMSMVGDGEGIIYRSKSTLLIDIIDSLQEFIKLPIDNWENYSKSGFVPFYHSEIISSEHYQKSWSVLSEKHDDGRKLLPPGLEFE